MKTLKSVLQPFNSTRLIPLLLAITLTACGSDFQEGGIGATINVSTARPFDYEGFQLVGSAKAMYETLSEDTSPSASVLVSNTFSDNKVGVLLAVSRQERDVQINRIETLGWRPGLTLSNTNDGVLASDVYLPRNWDQIVDQQVKHIE